MDDPNKIQSTIQHQEKLLSEGQKVLLAVLSYMPAINQEVLKGATKGVEENLT